MSTDGTSTSAAGGVGGQTVQGGYATPGGDIIRVLAPDGTVVDKAKEPQLSDDAMLDLYRALVRTRVFDEAAASLHRQGSIGFHAGARGEEATVIGSARVLRADDWLFPTQRELGAALLRGMSAEQYADHVFGNAGDMTRGRQMPGQWSHRGTHCASVASPSSSQLTHAVGFAWAAALKRDPIAVVAYFGEAATESGSFHDAMNFAGVFKPPVVLLCRNASGEPLADKGIAYGVESVRCDGNDVFAVMDAMGFALARALAGDGATLLEAMTSRPSSAADDDKDPIRRMRRYLEGRTGWADGDDDELWAELRREADEAFETAASKPSPPVSSMFEDVYEEPPSRLLQQRQELEGGARYPGRDKDGEG